MGVYVGITRLTQLMMKIAGLPCLSALNYNHEFGVVWLDSLGGWALFDAIYTEKMQEEEKQEVEQYGKSLDLISLCNNFPAVFDPGNFDLQQANEYFITETMFPDHFVYDVGDAASGFDKQSLYFYGVFYKPSPLVLTLKSDNNSIHINENMIQMNRYCKITRNATKIDNFDVFSKKFVKVNISESHVNETIKKDGFEFNLSSDGSKSRLKIKPLEGNVNYDLVPFLADIDVFDVDPDIKTVRYDLLKTKDSLKEGVVIPNGVRFEQINS